MSIVRRMAEALRTDREGPGRVVASLAIVGFLFVVVVENFPDAPVARHVMPRLAKAKVQASGLEQGWGMFVWRPDPPPSAQTIRARLTYSDGESVVWTPSQDRFVGAQRAARWSKFGEFARPRSHGEGGTAGQELWRPLAAWLARAWSEPGREIRKVELIARERAIPELGDRSPRPWVEFVFYTFTPS